MDASSAHGLRIFVNGEGVNALTGTPTFNTSATNASHVGNYAVTAAEALVALKHRTPDLLVMEVDLPDVNGLELCERLRANPATRVLPILILTARGSIQEKVAGFQAGADDYLVKPPSQRFFSSRLRLLLRIKDLQKKSYNGPESPPAPPPSDPETLGRR